MAGLIARVRLLLKTTKFMLCDVQVTLIDLQTVGELKLAVAFGMKAMFGQKDVSLIHGQTPNRFVPHKEAACQLWMKSNQIVFRARDANMTQH